MTDGSEGAVPFQAHIELLRGFLSDRDAIVAALDTLLDAQKKPQPWRQDKAALAQAFEDAFFAAGAGSPGDIGLRGQLQQVHWERGFTPRAMPGLHNDLPDAGEMMVRAFNLWRQWRWPAPAVRLRFAQALFNLYLLRQLELLALRIADDGAAQTAPRLAQVQALLDALWQSGPPGLPVLVRDARWLIPIAQSPTTEALHPYFDVAEQLTGALAAPDRLEVHRATITLAGGHLRSQLRHYNLQGTPLDEPSLVLTTRRSNALDFSMTLQGLVPLLEAYVSSCRAASGDRQQLASAILQGISADPELFVNRVDLLGPYTMIETLFIATDDQGRARLTPMGARHVSLLAEYSTWIEAAAPLLHADLPPLRPQRGAYSPHGVLYGFSSNITEHMTLKTLVEAQAAPFSLEDAFTEGAPGSGKLEWVGGWRRLPHIRRDVQARYDYPLQFAQQVFDRVAQAIALRVSGARHFSTGRLLIAGAAPADEASPVPSLPAQYILSSDLQRVAAFQARACSEADLLHDRFEGEFAVSYRTSGGWVGISKDFLTDLLGAGRDVKVTGLPPQAAGVLALVCAGVTGTA